MACLLGAVVLLVLVAVGNTACGQSAPPPGPPGNVQFLPGNGLAGVVWHAPGGTAGVTGYQVTAAPGSHTCTSAHALHCLVKGLTNGTVYHLSIRSNGPGGSSEAVTGAVTAGAPWAPGEVVGTPGDSTVTVGWFAPLSPASPITSYTVVAEPGFATCTSTGPSCIVTGLTNGSSYSFTVTATNAFGASANSASSPSYTPSVLAGGSAGIVYLGPVNANEETATGTILQRDAGISVALPNGRDLWIFGDTSSFSADASQSSAFIAGSTAARGRYIPGQSPTALHDIEPAGSGIASSNRAPAQFIPTPSDTYLPDGTGRACTPANGAVYTARWPTGAALLDDQARLIVTYTDVCVTSATNFTVEGWGFMIYAWKGGKIKTGPVDVFPPVASGAALPASRSYQSPVVSNGQVTVFTSECTQLFVACTAGTVTTTTVADNLIALATPSSYVGQPAVTEAPTTWTPVLVTIAAYPGGLRLIEQTSIGGTFVVFSSTSPTGPWHPFVSGVLPGCSTTPRGFCYAFVGHPELGSDTSLIMSYFKPDSPENANVGHVDLAAVPVPAG
jgi:hypothetical protein